MEADISSVCCCCLLLITGLSVSIEFSASIKIKATFEIPIRQLILSLFSREKKSDNIQIEWYFNNENKEKKSIANFNAHF